MAQRGRPRKRWSDLKESTKRKYIEQIKLNIKEVSSLSSTYEEGQKYRQTGLLPAITKVLTSGNTEIENESFEKYRNYVKRGGLLKERLSQVSLAWEEETGISLEELNTKELRKFYESKYYVLTGSNEKDSDALAEYETKNNETVQKTRIKDFITKELIPNAKDFEDLNRYNAILSRLY